jgi:hypothetical protein
MTIAPMAKPRAMPITMENNVIHIARLLRCRDLRGILAGATRQTGERSNVFEKDGFGSLIPGPGKALQIYVDCD